MATGDQSALRPQRCCLSWMVSFHYNFWDLRDIDTDGPTSLAAKEAGIPSILITNFSFDSVYSYLSTPLLDVAPSLHHTDSLATVLDISTDDPIPYPELAPLVEQIYSGYRCADLLVRLPGYIPIPSFFVQPSLPSFEWVDVKSQQMWPNIIDDLTAPQARYELHPCVPFSTAAQSKEIKRSVVQAPLLVRPPSSTLSVYTREGRSKLLSSIGVPVTLHEPGQTKVLVVSFGGQVFRKPSRPGSSTSSRSVSREHILDPDPKPLGPHTKLKHKAGLGLDNITNQVFKNTNMTFVNSDLHISSPTKYDLLVPSVSPTWLATPCHIWIPGAPPASKPLAIPSMQFPTVNVPAVHGTPTPDIYNFTAEDLEFDVPRLLPDSSWIAIVCGVSKEQWTSESQDKDSVLPEGFYVAPRDVYMPDLTAVGDVLLGKLVGYRNRAKAWRFILAPN
jgi:hypothetical protein